MIIYIVRFMDFGSPGHTQTHRPHKPYETWTEAKNARNELFILGEVSHAWVEKIDRRTGTQAHTSFPLSVDIKKERYGEVLRRKTQGGKSYA